MSTNNATNTTTVVATNNETFTTTDTSTKFTTNSPTVVPAYKWSIISNRT